MAGISIVDLGRAAQKYGWVVGENPNFGTGRVGGHAPGSYHYSGKAIDITAPTNVDVAPAYEGGKPIPWQQRTGELKYRLAKLGQLTEVLGPGDPGHDTHVHAALSGTTNLTPQQLEWAFTGRTKGAGGELTDAMPGGQPNEQQTSESTTAQNYLSQYIGNLLRQSLTASNPMNFANQMQQGLDQQAPDYFANSDVEDKAFGIRPLYMVG
jgi:hypothetical protein